MKLGSGAFEGAYSFASRFADGSGTNPEELIGAAHAGCFSMALSLFLGEAGFKPETIETEAEVTIVPEGEGFAIKKIHLSTRANIPGIKPEEFAQYAETAKLKCPVSQILRVDSVELDAKLV